MSKIRAIFHASRIEIWMDQTHLRTIQKALDMASGESSGTEREEIGAVRTQLDKAITYEEESLQKRRAAILKINRRPRRVR